MSPRRISGTSLATLVVLLSAILLPASAEAVPLHTTPFPPINGSGIGTSFVVPLSAAVDETSGNVFVPSGKRNFEEEDNAIFILGPEGGVPAGVAPPYKIDPGIDFGIDFTISAVDNAPLSPSKGTLYVPDRENSRVLKYALNPGTEQYEQVGTLTGVPSLAGAGAVTVDDDGNVYVVSVGVITKFSPSGVQLARIEMTEATRFPSAVAVDSAGDVFVVASGKAFKFPANGLGEIEATDFIEVPPFLERVDGVAVDRPSDTLFLTSGSTSVELDATSLTEKGSFTFPEPRPNDRSFIAINHAAGLIYGVRPFSERDLPVLSLDGPTLADAGTIAPTGVSATKATLHGIVNPNGLAVSECEFVTSKGDLPCEGAIPTDSSPHAVSAELSGLSPNTNYSYYLSVTNANGTNHSESKHLLTEPLFKTTPATAITPAAATLNGIARPEGAPITECEFEYGLTDSYGSTVPCEPAAGSIPADLDPHGVSAAIGGLVVGTTYHYRVTGSGGLGAEAGEDSSFVTLGPSLGRTYVDAVGETTATLKAEVNPRGKATTYHFEYGTEPCSSNPCASVPASDEAVGSGTTEVTVSQRLKGLAPSTAYHFRVVVTNPDGTGLGAEEVEFRTLNPPPSFGPCPNDAFRSGLPSAGLPDCRAYERATPANKNGGDVGGDINKVQASPSGDGITSQTQAGLPGGDGAEDFPPTLSRRVAAGWSTQGMLASPIFGDIAKVIGWTPDLAYSLVNAKLRNTDEDGASDGALLLRSSLDRSVEQLTPYRNGANFGFAGASADDSRIFFDAEGPGLNLTGNAATGKNNPYVYDRGGEELSLVGVLPNGTTPPGGSFFGSYDWWHGIPGEGGKKSDGLNGGGSLNVRTGQGYYTQETHAISTDGDRAFFTAAGTGQLYLRQGLLGESPETVRVSASQRGTPDPNGTKPAIFMDAATDGSVAFLTSCEKLTEDSTAHSTAAFSCETTSQGQDLYAYDAASGELTDLTPTSDPANLNGADVKGVLGASEDGSYVYFVANGDLDGPGPAEPGNCKRSGPVTGSFNYDWNGTCDLYVWHEGSSAFITTLAAGAEDSDAANWAPNSNVLEARKTEKSSRVSADGQVVVFRSSLRQTGYDNHVVPGGEERCGLRFAVRCLEYYRYDASTGSLACLTCNPSGTRPVADAKQRSLEPAGFSNQGEPFLTRFVSRDGARVFFETREKLVAADVNGEEGCPNVGVPIQDNPACQDVYEWEAPGTGSCEEASGAYTEANQGCLYLISTGAASTPSYFGDASASGEDVFFFTREQLVPSDKDQLLDVYDASVGGGLASQNQPPPPPPCEGEACRGPGSSAAAGSSAGSASFQGPGDPPVRRCPKGKVSKRGKCVRSHKPHHKKSKPHHRKSERQR